MQKIDLTFPKDLTKLAGNAFGKKTYTEQVKELIDFEQEIQFVFPDRIDRIATSFIQGFFDEIVKNIGIVGIKRNITIISSIPDINNFVIRNLE